MTLRDIFFAIDLKIYDVETWENAYLRGGSVEDSRKDTAHTKKTRSKVVSIGVLRINLYA